MGWLVLAHTRIRKIVLSIRKIVCHLVPMARPRIILSPVPFFKYMFLLLQNVLMGFFFHGLLCIVVRNMLLISLRGRNRCRKEVVRIVIDHCSKPATVLIY